MTLGTLQALGGIGLFLLGMVIMTDGLKGAAGDMLRRILTSFTRSPLSGALTGAGTTAILQSSSATTVAAVGFVSAGLLSFPQALGIVFGANVGTTITGWLVALFGFKFKLGSLALFVIFIGVLLKLLNRGRSAALGLAMAGFGLIFVGISTLQAGLVGLEGVVTPERFPTDTLGGRLQLVVLGIGMTLITQSSSAGVATALTAVHTGAIDFSQAAALIIGMDVGTTVKAVAATIGQSVESRRTGYSHVIYNLFTAAGALLLLSPYILAWNQLAPGALIQHTEFALVGFHTLFNFIGLLVVLPLTHPFARMIEKLISQKRSPKLDRLDHTLLEEPHVALAALQRSLEEASIELLNVTANLMHGHLPDKKMLSRLGLELDQIHSYADQIHVKPAEHQTWPRLNATIHALDHLQRLHERCDEEPERALTAITAPELRKLAAQLRQNIEHLLKQATAGDWVYAERIARKQAAKLRETNETLRNNILAAVAKGELDVPEGTDGLEAIRWMNRVSHHLWRICVRLKQR